MKPPPDQYQQLDKLVVKSAQAGCEALYCFYNFPYSQLRLPKAASCDHSYRGPSFWGCALAFPDDVKAAQSDHVETLLPIMHPWHLLACQSAKGEDLLSAASRFIILKGRRHSKILDKVPSRVSRLVELGKQRRELVDQKYLDFSYWEGEEGASDDLAGLIVFRDERD